MISPNEFISKWTYTNLVSYDPAVVQNLSIPASSKLFLIEAGLPLDNGFMVPSNTLPTLQAFYGDEYIFLSEMQDYRLLGIVLFEPGDIFAFYCLDEYSAGRVMMIYQKWGVEWVAEMLNSSVPQYAESLLILRRYNEWLNTEARTRTENTKETKEDPRAFNRKVKTTGKSVLQQLRRVDPSAFQINTAWEEQMYRLEGGLT